jgi:hypothetical protein
MATFEQPAGFPNILLVTGSDVYDGDYRTKLRDFLYGSAAASSPVREGTHDFWMTYAIPSEGDANWSFEDLSKKPRKMRGIVQMGAPPASLGNQTVQEQMSTMLQEVGHHWLVPANLRFFAGPTPMPMPTEQALTQAINDEARLGGPPLLARGNSHWSAFWQADGSPLDGLYFVKQGDEDGYAIWETRDLTGPTLSPAGLDPVQMVASYNDLDRIVMGAKTASAAYRTSNGAFRWLEPRLSAPHDYHAGLFVAFKPSYFIYFGFYRDHRTLGVQPTGGTVVTAALGPGYRPLADPFNAVALRIVRRGGTYHFQARYDNPRRALPGGAGPKLDDDLEHLPAVSANPGFADKKFQTIAKLTVERDPQAIGVLVRKWDHPFLAELAFQDLAIFQEGESRILRTDAVPAPFPAGRAYSLLPEDRPRAQVPVRGPLLRVKNGRLHIVAPFSAVDTDGSLTHYDAPGFFDHTGNVDRAPKVLTRAPRGDFAFATSAKIWRTIYTPWAGGYARGRRVWGVERSLAASTAEVPSNIVRDKQPAPPRNTYKVAFIIVAANRTDISDAVIERADVLRRYWDETFESATEDQRHSDSRLVLSSLSLSPASIGFGSEVLGDVSPPRAVRIINNGTADLTVCIPASATGNFLWPELNDVIPPGAQRDFQVEFSPTAAGQASGTLQVYSDAVGSPHSVALSGVGTEARLRLNPASINFGTAVVGEISTPRTFRIINEGTGDLTVSFPASLNGAFRWSQLAGVIAPGAERQVQVEFSPTVVGRAHRILSVQSNATGGPHSVDLVGTGFRASGER